MSEGSTKDSTENARIKPISVSGEIRKAWFASKQDKSDSSEEE